MHCDSNPLKIRTKLIAHRSLLPTQKHYGGPREQLLILISTPVYLVVIGLEVALSHFRRIPSIRGAMR